MPFDYVYNYIPENENYIGHRYIEANNREYLQLLTRHNITERRVIRVIDENRSIAYEYRTIDEDEDLFSMSQSHLSDHTPFDNLRPSIRASTFSTENIRINEIGTNRIEYPINTSGTSEFNPVWPFSSFNQMSKKQEKKILSQLLKKPIIDNEFIELIKYDFIKESFRL